MAEQELDSSRLKQIPIVSTCLSRNKTGDNGVNFPTTCRYMTMRTLLELKLGMPDGSPADPGTKEQSFGFSFLRVWDWCSPGQRGCGGLVILAGGKCRKQ